MPKRRLGSILHGLGSKRAADLVDGLLLSTLALIGFVLFWATVWAMRDGGEAVAPLFDFQVEFARPSGAPAGLFGV